MRGEAGTARSAKRDRTGTTSRSQSHRRITRRDRFAAQCNAAEKIGGGSKVTEPGHRRGAKHYSRQTFPWACGTCKSHRHRDTAQCVGAGAAGRAAACQAHARAPARTIQPGMEESNRRERAAHARPEGKKRGQQREGREAEEAHAKSRPPSQHKPLAGQAEDEGEKGLPQLSLTLPLLRLAHLGRCAACTVCGRVQRDESTTRAMQRQADTTSVHVSAQTEGDVDRQRTRVLRSASVHITAKKRAQRE